MMYSYFFICEWFPTFSFRKEKVGKKKILSWFAQIQYLFLRVFSFGIFSFLKEKYTHPRILASRQSSYLIRRTGVMGGVCFW